MNPYLRIGLRAFAVGLGGFIASLATAVLVADIDTDVLIIATNAGYTLFMSYVGLGTFTSLEPTLGVGAPKDKP